MKVDDEESFGGGDFLATFVFFAFDTAVTACEFGAEGFGDVVDVPVLLKVSWLREERGEKSDGGVGMAVVSKWMCEDEMMMFGM